MLDLIIIGAGPYGISLAAHAKANELSYRLLGYPMDFWANKMPQEMFIRTPHDFCSFSDANDELTIERFSAETGTELVTPLPRPFFIQYAMWFAEKAGVQFTPELATSLTRNGETYTVVTETGQRFEAKNLIIATGVEHHKYLPEIYRSLPPHLVSHTFGYTSFRQFAGKKVAVIGSGQSAWEAAALLHKEGSNVELLYRKESANYGGSRIAERYIRKLGYAFYKFPKAIKKTHWGQAEGSVAHFLRPYVEGKVPQTGSVTVLSAEATADDKVKLSLSDESVRIVDHVISASGYHINLDRVPFLEDDMLKSIEREKGYTQFPKLSESFESSLPGLYFAGPLSSHSHGPTFRFILGLRKTCRAIITSIIEQSAGHQSMTKPCCCCAV